MEGLKQLITDRPSLNSMILYAEHGQFLEEDMTELKEMLDTRGGQGFVVIEEGVFPLYPDLKHRIRCRFR
jgi:hypothetical protein